MRGPACDTRYSICDGCRFLFEVATANTRVLETGIFELFEVRVDKRVEIFCRLYRVDPAISVVVAAAASRDIREFFQNNFDSVAWLGSLA